jgi:diamine N-acetyltransferase
LNQHFTLRLARSEDAVALSRLMTETFLAAYGNVASADQLQRHIARHYSATSIEPRIDAGEIEVWVLENRAAAAGQAEDAGYLQLGLASPAPQELTGHRTIEVQRCYLRPEYIGSGGASLLIGQAQTRAREQSADALFLSVYQLAPRAVQFYRKHGFHAAAAIQFCIDDVVFDDWLMVWHNPTTRVTPRQE